MPDRQRLTETLVDLIKIDSPSGEEDAIDREVSARLSSLGLTVEHDSYNNIIARLEGVGRAAAIVRPPRHRRTRARHQAAA